MAKPQILLHVVETCDNCPILEPPLSGGHQGMCKTSGILINLDDLEESDECFPPDCPLKDNDVVIQREEN